MMNKTTTTAVTGVAVAMAAGTAAYMLANHGKANTGKKLKRNASKAIKTLGTVLDSVEYMMH
ncbi:MULTISPECIES: hypothetical protein [Anaerotruncus]|jgi:hypothetical protein|uniref:hypothetical protein n=1 Tax=Anaerotruncus TaxID=244127 RepID=UPI0008317469|nr:MULTISPECIES: hypothetical protein [Anaerotruncus]RGX55138.1 hypothetical protein DWV16_10235 [Anaerotruncus sp. AF02-27]